MVGTAGRAGGSEGRLWLLEGMYGELLNLGQFKNSKIKFKMQNFKNSTFSEAIGCIEFPLCTYLKLQ